MSDLRELYQEVILDHGKRPRNFRPLEGAQHSAEGYNPLCGDRVTVFLNVDDGVITDVTFQGSGCAISTASASMMTKTLQGKTVQEMERIFEHFQAMITGSANADNEQGAGGSRYEELGNLAALAGVREFPTRVKCASLAWHTLRAALRDEQSVTTE
jgi:nitrogen fixation NifU-like protein